VELVQIVQAEVIEPWLSGIRPNSWPTKQEKGKTPTVLRSGKMGRTILLAVFVAAIISGPAMADTLLPLSTEVDESSFGTLFESMSSPFAGGGFNGTLDSRVYVDATPASEVTFVFDLQIGTAFTGISELSIAATGLQNDLRIGEIISGVNGTVSSTTTNIPDLADAINNAFPIVDELLYEWLTASELFSSERSTLYVTTTGAVDVGVVSAAIQDGSTASALVLAPVDDPSAPDMNVPEPTSMVVLGLGALALIRRRRA
jgi:hypothetical protein